MQAEALSGKVLGTCTLQKLIGRGGMGAVFLAQQSRPRRQVAVKVLLPMTRLQTSQHAAFLERFRRETDAAAALAHPNIMPVHEYGERDGLAYLVMPYVSGGTLRDELEREGRLPFTKVVSYLEQLASALDYAHERGVIHRDIKPANILLTPEKRLLLTDFGLVKIIGEGHISNNPLSDVGMPMGTPDYMSPEQVVGNEIDTRADIYSLGILIYQMVAGVVPFTGETPMKVALQHLHNAPPSLDTLRPDLPDGAEKAILRAIAKRPAERYPTAREFANEFRQALEAAGVILEQGYTAASLQTLKGERPVTNRPRGLFDPVWRKAMQTPTEQPGEIQQAQQQPMPQQSGQPKPLASPNPNTPNQGKADIIAQTSMTMPSFSGLLPPQQQGRTVPGPLQSLGTPPVPNNQINSDKGNTPPRFPQRTGLLNPKSLQGTVTRGPAPTQQPAEAGNDTIAQLDFPAPNNPMDAQKTVQLDFNAPLTNPAPSPTPKGVGATGIFPPYAGQKPGTTGVFPPPTGATGVFPPPTGSLNTMGGTGVFPPMGNNPQPGQTGALMLVPPNENTGQTGMLKLVQDVKVVKVPVAGQPGQYVTGLLPVLPSNPADDEDEDTPQKRRNRRLTKIGLIVATILVLSSVVIYAFTSLTTGSQNNNQGNQGQINATATAEFQATATTQAKIVVEDPLDDNIRNWKERTEGSQRFFFQDGAYHIRSENDDVAISVMTEIPLPDQNVLSLTMEQVGGKDNSEFNFFGPVFRYERKMVDGKDRTTFYTFEVVNNTSGTSRYYFRKYEVFSGEAPKRTELWKADAGDELQKGKNKKNTVQITMDKDSYTFMVNGKEVGNKKDGSLSGGYLGMMVNMRSTEVAFSNLLVTHL